MWAHVGLRGALRMPEALVGRKSGVDSEVFHVRLKDVHYVHLARQLHQLQTNTRRVTCSNVTHQQQFLAWV